MMTPYFQVLGHTSTDDSAVPVILIQTRDASAARSVFAAHEASPDYVVIERTEVSKTFRQTVAKPKAKPEPAPVVPVDPTAPVAAPVA